MTLGFCECGCGRRTTISPRTDRKYGYIKGHPRRFIRGHAGVLNRGKPGRRREGLIDERFFLIEDRGFSSPCWVWQRTTIGVGGYGQVIHRGRKTVAHRAVWEERVGPWPDGLQADHLCRVRLCVNPEHIEPVTGSVNMRRSSLAKLTEQDHADLREFHEQGWSVRKLARHFGVTRDTIMRHLKIGSRHGQLPRAS